MGGGYEGKGPSQSSMTLPHHPTAGICKDCILTTKERPILFSGPMVRAILEGRKTQTRRVVNPQPEKRENENVPGHFGTFFHGWNLEHAAVSAQDYQQHSPYGAPGDRLWVRETWANMAYECNDPMITYRADTPGTTEDGWALPPGVKWKPSIHMPRAYSRITLEVTAVRVERLQEISHTDTWAEGIERFNTGEIGEDIELCIATFSELWESINGAGSWDVNPWVWVVEFERLTPTLEK